MLVQRALVDRSHIFLVVVALAVVALAALIPHRPPICTGFTTHEALPWVQQMRDQAGCDQ